jgi:hypothetical protein
LFLGKFTFGESGIGEIRLWRKWINSTVLRKKVEVNLNDSSLRSFKVQSPAKAFIYVLVSFFNHKNQNSIQ